MATGSGCGLGVDSARGGAGCLQVLRQIWIQQYYLDASADEAVVCVREPGNLPPAARCICSPYDRDAR